MKIQKLVTSFVGLFVMFLVTGCGGGDIDIVPASGNVTVSFTVLALPAANSVVYNRAATVAGQLEYEWGVYFDVNNDGLINTGDIALNLAHYKEGGSAETTNGNLSDFQARAWLYTTDTTQFLIPDASVVKTIVGNTITLSINRTDFTNLMGVNATTKVRFKAAYWDPATSLLSYDYYKDLSATVNEPSGSYTDDAGAGADDTASPNAMIDLQTMTLTFTD